MSASIPLSKVLQKLFSKTTPQTIYSYKVKPSVRLGSRALAIIFFVYGVTFTDWSWKSAISIYKDTKKSDELSKMNFYEKCKFYAMTAAPFGLSLIPFSLSITALLMTSRIASKVTYIPKSGHLPHQFQLTRHALLTGRPITVTRAIGDISRSPRTRVFTGKGNNGAEDKSSFVFHLLDSNASIKHRWEKFFLLPRSGTFWSNDSRTFDALFGGDSIKTLETLKRQPDMKKNNKDKLDYGQEEIEAKKNKLLLDKFSGSNSQRAKLHSTSAKDIVKNLNKSQNTK